VYLRESLGRRRLQTVLLIGVSTLIAACAAFGPLYARAVEQSITTTTLADQRTAATLRFSARPAPARLVQDSNDPNYGQQIPGAVRPITPEELAESLPPGFGTLGEPPVYGMNARVGWLKPKQRIGGIDASLSWTDDVCKQLVMVAGTCPIRPGEIAISTADRDNYGVDVGTPLRATNTDHPRPATLRITGVYRLDAADPVWFGVSPTGRSRPADIGGSGDAIFTPRGTFEQDVWGHSSTVQTAPLPGRVRLGDLPGLIAWVDTKTGELSGPSPVSLHTGLADVVAQIDDGRRQATGIIPLVMIQVAVFGLVVLAFAARVLIDQRRPEIAVARLRGRPAGRAGREVFVELGLLVVIGTMLGFALSLAMTGWVRRSWLAGTAPAELPWTTAAALATALLAGLVSVLLALGRVVRLPVATLLRTVPARRKVRAVTVFDVVLITAAGAGLAATLTGDGRGPLPIVTPTLLAVATGLLVAHLLMVLAGPLATGALRRGRLALGLAALQVARRHAASRLVPVIAVASALVAFAAQASAIADRNRDLRSGVETGAETVLVATSNNVRSVLSVLDTVDRDRRWSTLVTTSAPSSAQGVRTMGVEPESFRRVAIGGAGVTDDPTYQRLRATATRPVAFRGKAMTVTAGPVVGRLQASGGSEAAVTPRGVTVSVTYVNSLRVRATTLLGTVPLNGRGQVSLTAAVNCHNGCQLVRVHLGRPPGDKDPLSGTVTLNSLRGDADPQPVNLGRTLGWTSGTGDAATGTVSARPDASGLRLQFLSLGADLILQHEWVPAEIPVLNTPDVEVTDSPTTTAPGLDSLPVGVEAVGTASGPIPRNLYNTRLADLTTLLRWGGPEPPLLTVAEVWLNKEGAEHLNELTASFEKAGIGLQVRERLVDRDERYARSASALALRLTPVVGVAALLLALVVLLLLAAGTGRARTYDNAALRLAGVMGRTTANSTRIELIGLVSVATVAGTVCGLVGGQLALPLIPLFDTEQPAVAADLGISWPAAVLSIALSAAMLCSGATVLASAGRRRSRYGAIREEQS